MSLWNRIFYWLNLRTDPGPQYYRLDEKLQLKLINLALHEGRSEADVIEEIIASGLQKYSGTVQLLQNWQALSGREQDVTALACRGYTNPQIAAKLGLNSVIKNLNKSTHPA